MGTVTKVGPFQDRSGNYSRRVFNYAGPSSYATGGDSLTPESIGLGRIEALLGLVISDGTNIYWGYYNQTTEMILWYSATGTEITNATDLSTFSGRFEAIGI